MKCQTVGPDTGHSCVGAVRGGRPPSDSAPPHLPPPAIRLYCQRALGRRPSSAATSKAALPPMKATERLARPTSSATGNERIPSRETDRRLRARSVISGGSKPQRSATGYAPARSIAPKKAAAEEARAAIRTGMAQQMQYAARERRPEVARPAGLRREALTGTRLGSV